MVSERAPRNSVIEIVLGFGRARNSSERSPMMLMIGVVYLDSLLRWVNEHCHRAEFESKLVLLTVAATSIGST
jgi:hypothetical protein